MDHHFDSSFFRTLITGSTQNEFSDLIVILSNTVLEKKLMNQREFYFLRDFDFLWLVLRMTSSLEKVAFNL